MKCSFMYVTSYSPLPCFSTVPWNWGLWIIAEIYELNKNLSTFVMEYSGPCLSLLHCLEASVLNRFQFIERSLCLCLGAWGHPVLFFSPWLSPPPPAHRSRGVPAGGAAVSTAAQGLSAGGTTQKESVGFLRQAL